MSNFKILIYFAAVLNFLVIPSKAECFSFESASNLYSAISENSEADFRYENTGREMQIEVFWNVGNLYISDVSPNFYQYYIVLKQDDGILLIQAVRDFVIRGDGTSEDYSQIVHISARKFPIGSDSEIDVICGLPLTSQDTIDFLNGIAEELY